MPMAESVPTYYDVLRVDRSASPAGVRAAYRRLAQKYHPDKMPGNVNAARAMAAINTAYDVLSDVHRRAEHDLWIRRTERAARPAPVVPAPPEGLWIFMHPATNWAWYLLCGTLLTVISTLVSAVYLASMPARASAAKVETCKLAPPAAKSRCSSR